MIPPFSPFCSFIWSSEVYEFNLFNDTFFNFLKLYLSLTRTPPPPMQSILPVPSGETSSLYIRLRTSYSSICVVLGSLLVESVLGLMLRTRISVVILVTTIPTHFRRSLCVLQSEVGYKRRCAKGDSLSLDVRLYFLYHDFYPVLVCLFVYRKLVMTVNYILSFVYSVTDLSSWK